MNDNDNNILKKSFNRALGGVAGASAMAVQVGNLMWLRTTMVINRYGTSHKAVKHLYKEVVSEDFIEV